MTYLDWCDTAILAVLIAWAVMDRCRLYVRRESATVPCHDKETP